MFRSPFLHELHLRGFIHQCTDQEGLEKKLEEGPLTIYVGFDATAPSLHVGNLVSIMMLRIAQKHGHTPIVLMGGATTKVGDPTGKDESRPVLTEERILENISSIKEVFKKYVDFKDPKNAAILLNNDDWLSQISYLDFLKDYGRHFTINRMLTFDSVKLRLEREQPMTFLEFNYMLLQAYDFLELHKKYSCELQLGGSDQWGNIVNGVELVRRTQKKTVFGLTAPLITLSNGQKMGKSVDGAVWLNAEMRRPYDYWQFWRNVDDQDVIRFLKLYTDIHPEKIDQSEKTTANINDLKILLADEATKMAHGEGHLEDIHKAVSKLFKGESDDEIKILGKDEDGIDILETPLPISRIKKANLEETIPLFKALITIGFASSGGEARRLIRGGGCRVNGEVHKEENYALTTRHIVEPNIIKIASGKKKHAIIQVID